MVTYSKISPKLVNPRNIAGNAQEEEEEEEEEPVDFPPVFDNYPSAASWFKDQAAGKARASLL